MFPPSSLVGYGHPQRARPITDLDLPSTTSFLANVRAAVEVVEETEIVRLL